MKNLSRMKPAVWGPATLMPFLLAATCLSSSSPGATPGFPFTEDFSSTALRDSTASSAEWNTTSQVVRPPLRAIRSAVFDGSSPQSMSASSNISQGIAFGDINNDGRPDAVIANFNQANRVYLHNGTATPYSNAPITVTTDAHRSRAVALADFNCDGYLDIVVANADGQKNRLYINNGDNTFTGSDLTSDASDSTDLVAADLNGDGLPDVAVVNKEEVVLGQSRVYINDGNASPFSTTTGVNFGSRKLVMECIDAGDIDGDGNIDLVVGVGAFDVDFNSATNQAYINDGTGTGFTAKSIGTLTTDSRTTEDIRLGDINNDGHLDVVTGNAFVPNHAYLNADSNSNPFPSSGGFSIGGDFSETFGIDLADFNGDGFLDLVTADFDDRNRIYLNSGSTSAPFSGSTSAITLDGSSHDSFSIQAVDIDGDHIVDVGWANAGVVNRWKRNSPPAAAPTPASGNALRGRAQSLQVNAVGPVSQATLTATDSIPVHTYIDYFLSNNGGTNWFPVKSGQAFVFPTVGSDVRWRADLLSTSGDATPSITQIHIDGTTPDTEDLIVVSPFGTPTPPVGTNAFVSGASVSASMTPTQVTNGGERHTLSGWTGTGDVPASGNSANVPSFNLDGTSTLTWLWDTEYLLTASASSGGSVSDTNLWVTPDTTTQLTASPDEGFTFAGWSGDVPAAHTNTNPLTLTMDAPRDVTAHFDPILHSVTASAGPFGSISPSGVVQQAFGSTFVADIMPAPYYAIEDVLVDGVSTGALSQVSFTVEKDHIVQASFAPILTTHCVPVWWLASYGLTNGAWNVIAADDEDLDGISNGDEHWTKTDPTKADSTVRVTVSPVPNSQQLVLGWEAQPGVTYRLLGSPAPGQPFTQIAGGLTGNGPATYLHTPANDTVYRLAIDRPPCSP